MDRLQAMQTFVRVVEAGSFSAVARETGATQGAVSKQVAALERLLDVQLLARTTRSLALTEEGERYFEQTRRLLAEIAETEAAHRKKAKDARERTVLDEKLLKTIPLVAEANAMAEELDRGLAFEPKLMANQHKVPLADLKARYGPSTMGTDQAEAAVAEQMDTEVYIKVTEAGAGSPSWVG